VKIIEYLEKYEYLCRLEVWKMFVRLKVINYDKVFCRDYGLFHGMELGIL